VADFLPDGLRGYEKIKDLGIITETMENTGRWRPGRRKWTPNFFVNLIRFGMGSGRVVDKKVKKTLLDVGCGGKAQGDFNVDVYIPDPLPKNFVLASAELLPFKNNSFDIVRSAYVIEHNLFPTEMIKEHFRVCKDTVRVYTDNSDWLGVLVFRVLNTGSIFHDEHYFKWSKEYFSNLIDRLGFNGKVWLFNSSPSVIIKLFSLLGCLPRVGPIFYRDLGAEITKVGLSNSKK
jgi:SAM-dependent methyltransferase